MVTGVIGNGSYEMVRTGGDSVVTRGIELAQAAKTARTSRVADNYSYDGGSYDSSFTPGYDSKFTPGYSEPIDYSEPVRKT
jgi:hypothetical protein